MTVPITNTLLSLYLNFLKFFESTRFSLKPDYMIHLVAINILTIIGVDLLYLIAKGGQFKAFADYIQPVREVS